MPWPTKKLGEIVNILDNLRKPITKRDRVAGPYPYYGATGIQDYVADFIFNEDLVLIGEDGARWKAGDNSAYKISGKSWVNNHAHVLRPNRNILLDDWLIYFLNSLDLSEYITGTTVKKLNQEKLRSIKIPLPPIGEQKRIVVKLEKLLARVDEAKRLRAEALEATNNLLSAELHKIFDEGKKKGWEEKELGYLFDITSSKRVFKSEWTMDGIPFYRAREIVSMARGHAFKSPIFVSEEMYEKYKEKYGVPKSGDILATGVGTLGVTYCVKDNDKFYFKDGNIIWLKRKYDVNSAFVDYFFKSDVFREQVDANAGGATVRTFTIKTANKIKILLPSLAEQKKIVARMDALSEKVGKLKKYQLETARDLEALSKSILHQAFEGKL